MLREVFYCHHSLIFCILTIIIFQKLSFSGSFGISAPSFLSKCTFSEPNLATIYLYWLDLSYLPALYLLLIFFYSALQRKFSKGDQLCLLLVIILYNIGLGDLFSLNYSLEFSDYSLANQNSFLTNNLNRYHPLIFYTSVLVLGSSLLHNSKGLGRGLAFHSPHHNIFFFRARPLTLFLNVLALTLGGWWALQEWTWGG